MQQKITKDIKWFISKSTIIITILSIIVSIYANVFESLGDFNGLDFLNPQKYIEFFDRQGKGQISPVDIKQDTTIYYSHLIIQDRTMSTLQTNENNKKFADTLFNSLKTHYPTINDKYSIVTSANNKQLLGLKDLYVLKFYEKILKNDIPHWYRIVYYDGNSQLHDVSINTDKRHLSWEKVTSENKHLIVDKFRTEKFYESLDVQKTNLNFLFGKIREYCNSSENGNRKTIVTIISDFYHDDPNEPLSEDSIKAMQTGINSPVQFNLVYIVPNVQIKKAKSDSIVDLLVRNICGSQHIIPINTADYTDKNGTEKFKHTDILLTQCFSSIGPDKKRAKFYYPKESELNYETAECKVVINSIDTIKYNWRITVPYSKDIADNCFIYYDNGNEKSRSHIAQWHTSSVSDTLKLMFPLTSAINDNQYTLEIVQGNTSKSFLIQYGGTIPINIANVAKYLVYILMVLFVLFIGVKTYEIYQFEERNSKTVYGKIKYFVTIIFSLLSVVWFFYSSKFQISWSLFCAIIQLLFLILQILIRFPKTTRSWIFRYMKKLINFLNSVNGQ